MDGREANERLRAWGEKPGAVAVLTDIDGTLAPIVPTPDTSEVSEELKDSLRRLSGRYLLVAAISGRKTKDASQLLGLEDVVYFGNHGFEILRDGEVEVIPEAMPYLRRVKELERLAKEELAPQGAFVEEEGITASVHYRNAPREVGERRGTAGDRDRGRHRRGRRRGRRRGAEGSPRRELVPLSQQAEDPGQRESQDHPFYSPERRPWQGDQKERVDGL